MGILSRFLTTSSVIAIGAAVVFIFRLIQKKRIEQDRSKVRKAVDVFNYLLINIVTTVEDCDRVVHELRKRSMQHKALGFDCEWVTSKGGGRQPVALLQLSSYDGYCGLFRLNYFPQNTIPNSLKDLLECEDIYKLGVAPTGDAKYIANDYQVIVQGTIDIRYIVEMCGYKSGGLAALTESILNVALNKHWKIRGSNWEATELSPAQIHYAASDAHAAILIFIKALENYNKRTFAFWEESFNVWDKVDDICWEFNDRNYKVNGSSCRGEKVSKKIRRIKETAPKHVYRGHAARSKPLYHNCFLQAPDGELLCTCDNDKANWYINKGLADLITEDPLTVRLRFEPVARSTGDVGKYYQMKKENQCVVCGATNSYIRKIVVPREYRKYFPEIMKDHSSHDVLLLCMPCHQRSNMQDQVKRRHLAVACDAPIAHENPKVIEDAAIKKVRMAARALLVHGHKHTLPDARRLELEAIVLAQFPGQNTVTNAVLEEAAVMQQITPNESFIAESHGFRVVAKYLEAEGGLLKLEEEWRSHFLATMNPKYMPELWSIHHNRDRLRLKWEENRLDAEHLKSMGVVW